MRHFMQDNIVEAVKRFLGKFEVDPNLSALRVATAPLRFHTSDAPTRHRDMQAVRPFRDTRLDLGPEKSSIPAPDLRMAVLGASAFWGCHGEPIAGLQVEPGTPDCNFQSAGPSKNIVGFT